MGSRCSRVGQIDYRRIFSKDPGTNALRLAGGLRFTIK